MAVCAGAQITLRAEAAQAYPRECCGILVGHAAAITAALPARNLHPAPEAHFEIDPQALVDAHRAARAGGPEVIGYYHSHPTGPAEPSATDRALAAGDGRVWAIIGHAGNHEGDITFWRDEPTGFVPLAYTTLSSCAAPG